MQYGVLSHKWTTAEDRDEWEKNTRAVLQQMYDVDYIRSIGATDEKDKVYCLYFPIGLRTHLRFIRDGFKVDHIVDDYVFYAGMLNAEEGASKEEPDFGAMYTEFERKYNPYPVQMARYEAFRYALKDGLIDRDTYKKAEKYFGSLWNYVGD